MRERLIEPIVVEHVGMGGRDTVATILTHYDEESETYTSKDGEAHVTHTYLDLIRRGEFSWLRVRS